MTEAMKMKLYEHIFGLAHDTIDIVQIRMYENAHKPIPDSIVRSIMGRTQSENVSKPADSTVSTGTHPPSDKPGTPKATESTESSQTEQDKAKATTPY